MSNTLIILGVVLITVLYLEPNVIDSVLNSSLMENFTQRISNLQALPFMLRDRDVYERRRDYHRMNSREFSKIGTKAPDPVVPDVKDAVLSVSNGRVKVDPAFTHSNMVPFFRKEPYKTYTDGDETHPHLERYADKPKKSVIAPLYDLGQTRYANLNETSLIGGYNREVENYKTNTVAQNSKNFEFVGGDPVRVGRGIVTADTEAITGISNTKEIRDGTIPSGGFHPMYRPDELTRDQLTGETRPLFNEAYVFVGVNGEGVNVPADPSFIGQQTKAMKAKAYACKEGIATSGTIAPTARADIVRKQHKTNDAPNPYRGPALLAQSSGVNNIESVYEPRLPKSPETDDVNCVNYYATTSDPATYENKNTNESFVSKYAVNVARDSRSNEPMKSRESYADYSYIKDNVQRHVYKDYDPYDYNTVHNGNEYVTVTRTGNINSEERPVLYNPESTDKLPKNAETDRIRKLTQLSKSGKQTVGTLGSTTDRKMYLLNDPFRMEYINNNRDNTPVLSKNSCVSIDTTGEYAYREDRKSNEYIEQKPERYNSQREDNRSGYNLLDIELYKEKKAGTLTERIGTLGSGLIKNLFGIGVDDSTIVNGNGKRDSIDALEHSNGYTSKYQDNSRVNPELRKTVAQYDQMAESLFNTSSVAIKDRKNSNIKNREESKSTLRDNIHIENDFMK